MRTGEIKMNDTMTEAGKLLSDLERLAGRTITKSRKDRDRMIGLILNRLIVMKRNSYEQGREGFKIQALRVVGPCRDRDITMQKVMDAIEDIE